MKHDPKPVLVCGVIVALTLLWGATAAAQPASDPSPAGSDATSSLSSPPAGDAAGWHVAWDEHPSLLFGKDIRIDFRLRLQERILHSDAATGNDDDTPYSLARKRIGVNGSIKNLVDFQVEGEIGATTPWKDVFVNYRQWDAVQVEAGKFKLPFSLDENTSATNLDFVYRSMAATHLAPGRDKGVMVHGRVRKKTVRYELGVFHHDGNHSSTTDPTQVFGGTTLAGRVSFLPFRRGRRELRDLLVGVAFTDSTVPEGYPGLHGHTVLDSSFYPANLYVNGKRYRTGLELRWRPGPASVKAEYMRVSTERLGESVEDGDLPALVARGWYVSGTYALTGEKKADDLTIPRRPLFKGGPGAIEVAARIEDLSFGDLSGDPDASSSPRSEVVLGNGDRAATLGLNWYPIRHVKVQLNVIHERLFDPTRGPAPGLPGFWSRVLTFQLDL